LICNPFERRIATAKFIGDEVSYLIDKRIAGWILCQQFFCMAIQQSTQTRICLRDWQ